MRAGSLPCGNLRFVALLAALPLPALAQSGPPPTALPVLELQPSPALHALGGAGVALPTADPYAWLINPAHLGLAARDVAQAGALYPGGEADWLALDGLTLGGAAATVGVRLPGRGLVLGAGFGTMALGYGEQPVAGSGGTAAYRPVDRTRALALGAATTGAVRLAAGAAVRYVSASDGAVWRDGAARLATVRGLVADWGLIAAADVGRLAGRPEADLPALGRVRPHLEVTAGYAQASVGGVVRQSGEAHALPRTARLGWSLQAGLDRPLRHGGAFRLVGAEWSVQAEHSLVRAGEGREPAYAALLGDLDPLAHGALGRGGQTVTGRRGVRVTLAETVAFSRGGFDGWGYRDARTHGVEVRLAGPLKATAALAGSPRLAAVARRLDVRYTHAVTFAGHRDRTTLGGLTLVVRR